jgi:hypothetical protein
MDNLDYLNSRRRGRLSEEDRITIDYLSYRRRCYRRIRLIVPQVWETGQTFTVTFPEPAAVESEEQASWLL